MTDEKTPAAAAGPAAAAAALAITIDLIAEDEALRAALPAPQRVRIPQQEEKDDEGKVTRPAGEAIIEVPPIGAWPGEAHRYAMSDLWVIWARSVLSEEDLAAWQRAGLRNFQIKRIYDAAAAAGGLDSGK